MIQYLFTLFEKETDLRSLAELTRAISYLIERLDDLAVEILRDNSHCIRKSIETLEPQIADASLHFLGSISTGDTDCVDLLLENGIIDALCAFLGTTTNTAHKSACWLLSNITAGEPHQVLAVMENQTLIVTLQNVFDTSPWEVQKEVCRCVLLFFFLLMFIN
jgi:hypothetical protein